MSDVVTIPREEFERQEERLKRLARDKANVQLVVNLITSLTAVEGLDNTIEAMLRAVLEHVGGTKLSIYYRIDQDLYYADILGARRQIDAIEDPLVRRVFESRAFLERRHDFSDTKMLTPEFTSASTWVFPLVVGADLLGAFKIENMHMQAQDLHAYLPTFFSHAALILKNSILGHTRLQKAYVQLEQEVIVRRQAEQELREAKSGLEDTVAARTAELQRVNRLYNVLSRVNQATHRASSRETFLVDVCRIVVEHGQFQLAWIGEVNWETLEVNPVALAGPAIDYVAQLKLTLSDTPEGWGPVRTAVGQAKSAVRNNLLHDSTEAPWRNAVLKAGFKAEIAVPIARAGRVEGVLTIYSVEPEVFHGPEIALLEEIAADIAMALDRIHSEAMRAQAEEALRAKTEELDRYFTNALDLLCIADTDGYFHRLNPEWATSLGYPISELEGRRFLDLVHPDDMESTLQAVSMLADQKELLSFTNRYRHKDGSYRWIEWRSFPSGKYIYAVARDITERKRAEQKLHEKERHSQSLLRLSRRLELAQTFMEVVDAARDEVREIIGYQSLWVFLIAEDKKHAYALLAGGTMSEAEMSEAGAAILTIEGDRMLEEIAEAKGIVVVEDARTDPRTDKEMVARMENRTIVNVPIIFMDRHLGAVGTGTYGDEGVHPPTKSEEEYLSALASHMAVTLDRLHLLTERKQAEQERLAHLRFFENLDKVNRAIQGTRDLDSMMNSLLGEVLSIFDCDRAWLFHPCDPDAPTFRVPMEVTKPEYPGAKMLNVEIPIPPEMAQNLREALESAGPVTYTAGTERPVNNMSAEAFGVKSQMMVAVYPKSGKPWAFGIHQCSYPRVWTPEEQRFFLEISWRLADSLTSLLAYRDLQVSEKRLAEAQRIAKIGNWELDVPNNRVWWSDEAYRIFELDPREFEVTFDAFLGAVHPDDRERVQTSIAHALQNHSGGWQIDYRLARADGTICFLHEEAETVFDRDGSPLKRLGTVQDITERKRAEEERATHLWFFESMNLINQAILGTNDLERMLSDVLDGVLRIFDCDRAWLVYPCDPEADTWCVPMERTRPEYPGAKAKGQAIPMDADVAQTLRELLASDRPVKFGPETGHPLPEDIARQFGFRSFMSIAVRPKMDKPWQFGIHQCSYARVWTAEEEILFQEIGHRLADSLTGVLAHRNLRQSERHLRTLVENIPDCISRFDEDCRRLFVNPAVVKTVGIPAGELIGKTMSESGTPGDPDHNAHLEEVIRKTFREGAAQTLEAEWATPDGIRRFEILSVPEKDESGKAVTVLGIAHDITERKQAEEALRRLNRELQAISSCNQVLMRAVDEQTLLDDVCRIICDEAGYRFAWVGYAEHDDAKTIRPMSWAGVEDGYLAEANLSWADTERGRGPSGKTIRSGKSSSIQDFETDPEVLIWREKALERGYRSSIALPLKDEDGNTFGSLQIYSTRTNVFTEPEIKLLDQLAADLAFGITALRTRAERKRAEEALQEERKLFIGGPNVAFLWRAVEGWPVEYVSPNVVEQFGYTPEDFTSGRISYAGIVHPDDVARIAEEGKVAGESGTPCFDQEYRIACKDGGYRWVYDFTVFVRDPDGAVTHFRGYINDITARRRVEEIRQARIFLLEFADSHTVDELLTATLDRIEALTGSCIGFYHFVEDDQETIFLQSWSTNTLLNMCAAERKGSHYAVGQAGVWTDCVHRRGPVIHNDYAFLPHRKGMPEGHAPVQREVVVPVFRGGLIKAIVGVGNKFTDYTENDVEIVSQLADLSWDIVERKRTQEKIRQTAEEWQTTFDSITDMVSIQDTEFKLVRVNKAYADTLGSTCDALAGRKCHEVVHGTDCPIENCPHGRTLELGEAFVEELFEPSLGVYLEASTSPIFNDAGEVTGSIHIAKDITARKQAQDALRRSELEKSILNEIANVFLTIPDEDMYEGVLEIVVGAIPSPFGIFGYIAESGDLVLPSLSRGIWNECQVLDKCVIFPASTWGNSLWGKAIRERRTQYSLGPFHTPEGHVLIDCFLAVPILYGHEAIGLISLANKDGGYSEEEQTLLERIATYISPILNARLQRDQEERTRMEAQEEIRRLNAELEQRVRDRTLELESANKELESFSYSVSHDLRAPLRHVTGFVSLLSKRASDDLDEKSRHYLTVISESAIQMGKLIDDVLSFSRMGRAEIVKTPVSLQDLLTEVLQVVAQDLEGRDITWLGGRLPGVYGSREMLRIVMTNLISNALKFTSQKPNAIIELGQIPDDAEDIVFVRDNGAGFDMKYVDKLFGLFQRLHNAEEFEGTGLGLANVRRIIRRHGGRTWAEGVPGEGATFYFSLPKE